ncbi:MAG: helicase-associated domain-containing protein [Anaerolineaceae bacterium]
MPDLTHMLSSYDSDLLNIIAETWGIKPNEMDEISLARQVSEGILAAAQIGDPASSLPDLARAAMQKLVSKNGRLPVPVFSRQFGEIRVMGAGKRERERPDQNPTSPAEILWYGGFIGKAFLDAYPAPQEYIYIPDDLLPFIFLEKREDGVIFGRLAAPEVTVRVHPASDRILDEACTLLAALRMGLDPEKVTGFKAGIPIEILKALLTACGLLDEQAMPIPDAARLFLEAPRAEALSSLLSCWQQSPVFNELLLLPNLNFEGEIHNGVLHTRQNILRFLEHIPRGGWCDLAAFINDIHNREPDFQRPAGDYDSWFIRRKKDQAFLRGFTSWNEVDGALIRFFICGPLHWLGILDLASTQSGGRATAFRLSTYADDLFSGRPPREIMEMVKPLHVHSDGVITIPRECPRAVRYQIARASRWISAGPGDYRYQITPDSLNKAVRQGLKVSYLISILKRHHQGPLPPNILQAVERWDQFGLQAQVKNVEIITFESEEIMKALRVSQASRFLLEGINPASAIIRPGTKAKIMRALLEMGYLSADIGETSKTDGKNIEE